MQTIVYHEGNLANDRHDDPSLDAKAKYWMAEQEAGNAALVQQRTGKFGNGQWKYMAQVGDDHVSFSQ